MSREWYPWFPHRFWTSERVALMDDAAVALYKFLLDHEWENGPFSSDERVLRALCARFKSFETSWPQVLPCFQVNRQGKLFNRRMESERELERQASHARAERSKNAWTKRRDESESTSRADAEHVHSARSRRGEQVECSTSATDLPTYRPTDLPTDGRTDGGAGGPAPGASPTAPRARKRAVVVLDPGKILAEFPVLDTPDVRSAVDAYLEARKGKHGKWTAQGMRVALRKFEAGPPSEAVAAFETATEGPWQTVWPNKSGGRNGHAAPPEDIIARTERLFGAKAAQA